MPFDLEGHRGCRGLMPENTIAAMLHALELGVTTLEMDAVITADSQVILSHEPFFNHEITTKKNGESVSEQEEKDLNIYKMTYAETLQFDVGLKPNPRFPAQQKLAAHKPLLRDVIDSAEAYVKNKKRPPVYYNIETKTTAATDGLYHPEPEPFVRLLMNVLSEKGIQDRVIIQSFDVRTLQFLHAHYPQQQTALLIDEGDTQTFKQNIALLGFKPTLYSPHYSLVTANLISQCHAVGIKVIPWTVNTKVVGEVLKKLGVDGLITDYPNLFTPSH
ncbi:MAG TPA: glycerophosphodiester phosphodiesterase family protein [Chitinophagaceae bacterium]|nr:glycerophosphodiester phosphodiesterase family protein [Chitinophagaceae bacterium]